MNKNGYTLVEAVVSVAFVGIVATVVVGVIAGNSPILSNKQSCMNAGGKWTEGIQYGRITQFCTYN